MTGQAGLPGMVSPEEHEADLREREDDPTPRGVAQAVLRAAGLGLTGWLDRRLHVVDICAGWGCWSSELLRLRLPMTPRITGIEIDERKRETMARWCHDVVIGDALVKLAELPQQDLVMGNPAFSLLAPKVSAKPTDEEIDAAVEASLVAAGLRCARAVLLLHHGQAFLRGRVGRAVLRRYPPALSFQIPGAVSFRSEGKTDSRCYSATLWRRGHSGPCATYLLPELGREDLRWRVPPGTEDSATAAAMGLVEVSR